MRSGDRPGLQNRRAAVHSVAGGFDPHSLPPSSTTYDGREYVPSTNTWTEEAPLLVGKSEPAAGRLGTTIVAADGYTASEDTDDNEEYNVSTNTWSGPPASGRDMSPFLY